MSLRRGVGRGVRGERDGWMRGGGGRRVLKGVKRSGWMVRWIEDEEAEGGSRIKEEEQGWRRDAGSE